MTPAYQTLFSGIAAWLQATNPSLTVIYSTQGPTTAPRPTLPYATVLFTGFDIPYTAQDEQVQGTADSVTISGGTTGTVYSVAVGAQTASYTRLATDTAASTASALAALLGALDDVVASASGSTILLTPSGGTVVGANLVLVEDLAYYLVRGQRRAVASIQAFGGEASNCLQRAMLGLGLPSVQAVLSSYRFWVTPKTGVRNMSRLLDTGNEQRALLEVDCQYVILSDLEAALSAALVAGDFTFRRSSADADPLHLTFSEVVP